MKLVSVLDDLPAERDRYKKYLVLTEEGNMLLHEFDPTDSCEWYDCYRDSGYIVAWANIDCVSDKEVQNLVNRWFEAKREDED